MPNRSSIMGNNSIYPKTLTCRYWALGPRCPNIDKNGVDMCIYAHWDTGPLVGWQKQRGTCANWVKGCCRANTDCYYEHRYTGIPGLYQGVIGLCGMDLEIAEAAANAGFNTLNHEALMDLIWSVKRVARRNSSSFTNTNRRKDPIYPDRHRPSGIGDNTVRNRHVSSTDISPPPFHHTRPLVRFSNNNNNNSSKKKSKRKNKGLKNKNITIKVSQSKVQTGRVTKATVKCAVVKVEESQREIIRRISNADERRPIATNASTERQNTTHAHVDREPLQQHELPLRFSSTSAMDNVPTHRKNTTNELNSAISHVTSILEQTRKSMINCQLIMRDLFHANDTRLSRDGIFPIMTALSRHLYRVHDEARDGMAEAHRSKRWLEEDEGRDGANAQLS